MIFGLALDIIDATFDRSLELPSSLHLTFAVALARTLESCACLLFLDFLLDISIRFEDFQSLFLFVSRLLLNLVDNNLEDLLRLVVLAVVLLERRLATQHARLVIDLLRHEDVPPFHCPSFSLKEDGLDRPDNFYLLQ